MVLLTLLIMKVKKLENRIKSSKARRKVRLIVSEDKDDLEDPSKQGMKIAQLDENEGITLPDISIVNVQVSTAGAEVCTPSLKVKTAAESLVKGKQVELEQERLGYEEVELAGIVDEKKGKYSKVMKELVPKIYQLGSSKNTKQNLNMKGLRGTKTNEEQSSSRGKELSEEEL
ncbi:hypothetical protein Tco_0451476 [Tanacetum coccineum]